MNTKLSPHEYFALAVTTLPFTNVWAGGLLGLNFWHPTMTLPDGDVVPAAIPRQHDTIRFYGDDGTGNFVELTIGQAAERAQLFLDLTGQEGTVGEMYQRQVQILDMIEPPVLEPIGVHSWDLMP